MPCMPLVASATSEVRFWGEADMPGLQSMTAHAAIEPDYHSNNTESLAGQELFAYDLLDCLHQMDRAKRFAQIGDET